MGSENTSYGELQWETVPKTVEAAREVVDFVERAYDQIYLKKTDEVDGSWVQRLLRPEVTVYAVRFRGFLVGTVSLYEGPYSTFPMHKYHIYDQELAELEKTGSLQEVGDLGALGRNQIKELEAKLGITIPEKKIIPFLMNLVMYYTLIRNTRYQCIHVREAHARLYESGFGFKQVGESHTSVLMENAAPTTEVLMVLDYEEVRAKQESKAPLSFLMKMTLREPPPETLPIRSVS